MKVFICEVCGHIAFNEAPDNCPVCFAPKEKFSQNDNIFKESEEKSPEAAVKHIPDIKLEKKCGLIPEGCSDAHIRIGETLHPMEDKHFIQFIDCYIDEKFIKRAHLTPKINPATAVHFKEGTTGELTVVQNCNIHGYWLKKVSL